MELDIRARKYYSLKYLPTYHHHRSLLSLPFSLFLCSLPLSILQYHIRCSSIDLVAGVTILEDNVQGTVDFANSVAAPDGGIADLVYNASIAAANLHNLNVSLSNYHNAQPTASLKLMRTAAWRRDAYNFCVYPCKGIVLINSYGSSYEKSINGESYQIEYGSCNDSTSISDAAW